MGRAGDVRARRTEHGQAKPYRECERDDLWLRLGERRLPHRGAVRAHSDGTSDSRARSEDADRQTAVDAGSLPLLGRHTLLDRFGGDESRGNGQQRPRLDVFADSAVPEDQPSFCANHPSAALAPQPRNFRQIQYYDPQRAPVPSGQHLFRLAPRSVRERTKTRRSMRTALSAGPSGG